jgi:molybdate transport system regulatory protein
MTTPTTTPHPLDEALGHAISDKRLEVLRRVGQTGSISQAARDAGISYKAAWQAMDTLTNLSGLPLVDRSVGGNGGGGARITAHGLRLLALADELAKARAQVLARFDPPHVGVAGTAGRVGGAGGGVALGLRTSMRNQLPCEVQSVVALGEGPMVRVTLQTAGGDSLASTVTWESVDLLGLQPGLPVLALCKATAVTVSALDVACAGLEAGSASWAVPCAMRGRVVDISSGTGPREVALSLQGGSLWVGFAVEGASLGAGDVAQAVFLPSAVVIGLAD